MINSSAVMDYYINSNELRVFAQRLRFCFDQVFEMSLNTSLATGKIQTDTTNAEVYEVMAARIETIAKSLRGYIAELIQESNHLTKYALGNKQDTFLLNQFSASLPLVHGEKNVQSVKAAMERLESYIDQTVDEASEHLQQFSEILSRMKKLNEQTWLTLSQLRVQLSQNESETNLEAIVLSLDELGEKIEGYLDKMSTKSEGLKKILNSRFQSLEV